MRNRRDFIKGTIGLGVVAALAACAPQTSGTPAQSSGKPRTGGVLRVGVGSDFVTPDAHRSPAAVDLNLFAALYDPLVQLGTDLSVKPALAERWDVSKDGLALTFFLRKNVVFHDGEAFDAAAVKFNYERMINDPKSPRRVDFSVIKSVDVVDPQTVRFNLNNPSSPLLSLFAVSAQVLMLSPKALRDKGEDFARSPVGTGPFSFVEWVKDDHLTVRKFAKYWDKDADGTQLPYLDEIKFTPVPDIGVKLVSLKTGGLDLIDSIPPKDIASLQASKDVKLSVVPSLAFEYFEWNFAKAPFDKLENRLAMEWCVDRKAIIDGVFFGSGTPAHSPVPPPSWAFDKSLAPYRQDIAKARQLAPNGFTFTALITNTPIDKQVAEVFRQQFAQAGITMNIELLEFGALVAKVTTKEHQAALIWFAGRPDPDGNVNNFGNSKAFAGGRVSYNNPRVDELLLKAQIESDRAKRTEMYHEIDRLMNADGRAIFVRFPDDFKAMSPSVGGFNHVADGTIRPETIWLQKA